MSLDSDENQSQQTLETFRAGTTTEDITRTIRLRLEGAAWKHERVKCAIEDWQRVARYTADLLPSFPPYRWGSRDTQLRRVVRREFDNLDIYAHDRDAAVAIARNAFSSWHERGRPGDRPQGEFGDGDYLQMSTSSSSKKRRQIAPNNQGYGLEVSLINERSLTPSSMWFHADAGEYQREWLELVTDEDEDADLGVVELRYDETGQLWAHISVSKPVEVYEPGDVATTVGVDFGERVLWAAAVVDSEGVESVELESGREFRHYREQLERQREQLSEQGDLKGVRETRGDRERYTEQETHTATRRIVELASTHAPCKIRFEDLSDYRETATDAIHDWPHGMLTEQLAYKATEAGLPVEAIDPAKTSISCRKCGETNPAFRDGDDFECWECGYEVHADVNAAINIATWEGE